MSGADMLVEPDTGEVTVLMSKDEAEEITLKIKQYVGVVCQLVKEAHDKQAWKALGYPSWTTYCKAEFNVGKSRSYQLVKYAEVIALGTDTTGLPESTIVDSLPEGTARGIDRSRLAALLEDAYSNLPADADLSTRRQLFDAVLDQLAPTSDAEPPTAPDPSPEAEAPPSSEPVTELDPFAASEARGNALMGDQTSDVEAPTSSPSDAPGQVPAPAPVPPSDGSPACVADEDRREGDGSGTPDPAPVTAGDAVPPAASPALPADWRTDLANACYLLRLPVALLADAMGEDDAADLKTLFTHVGDALDIYESIKADPAKEQNA